MTSSAVPAYGDVVDASPATIEELDPLALLRGLIEFGTSDGRRPVGAR